MNKNALKQAMIELWEKTFHDSQEYINLIFDNYFNEKYVAYKTEEGKLVAALLGIPYKFGSGNTKLSGLYLCGIATEVPYRRKGFMKSLLDDINKRARDEFDFTFLIPANDLIANYYRNQGYFNSFYRIEKRYTSVHDFKNDFISSLIDSDQRIRNLKISLFNSLKIERFTSDSKVSASKLMEFISNYEHQPHGAVNIIHSHKDLEIIIRENEISDSYIFYSVDKDEILTGVVFARKNEIKRLEIPAMFLSDHATYYALLKFIKDYFHDYSLSVYSTTPLGYQEALTGEFYNVANPDGDMLESLVGFADRPFNFYKLMEPYGMAKLLNFSHIVEYLAQSKPDSEFNLLIKDSFENKDELKKIYKVKNGRVFQTFEKIKEGKDKNILELSVKEFSEIVLRRKDANGLIMEAFGIPRLPLEMCLMLD